MCHLCSHLVLVQHEPGDGVREEAEDGDGGAAEAAAVDVGLDVAAGREVLEISLS